MAARHPTAGSWLNLSILLAAVLLVVILSLPGPHQGSVLANGAIRAVVKDQRVGPYKIQVGIQPAPAKVGNLHVAILVKEFEVDSPITNAEVLVAARGPEGSTDAGPVQAQHTLRNLESYEANLPLDMAGEWTLSVEVDSDLGIETLEVPLAVSEPGGFSLALAAALGIAAMTVLVWGWGQVRRLTRRRAAALKNKKEIGV